MELRVDPEVMVFPSPRSIGSNKVGPWPRTSLHILDLFISFELDNKAMESYDVENIHLSYTSTYIIR